MYSHPPPFSLAWSDWTSYSVAHTRLFGTSCFSLPPLAWTYRYSPQASYICQPQPVRGHRVPLTAWYITICQNRGYRDRPSALSILQRLKGGSPHSVSPPSVRLKTPSSSLTPAPSPPLPVDWLAPRRPLFAPVLKLRLHLGTRQRRPPGYVAWRSRACRPGPWTACSATWDPQSCSLPKGRHAGTGVRRKDL